jgi:hypothetical protein
MRVCVADWPASDDGLDAVVGAAGGGERIGAVAADPNWRP